MSNHPYGQGNVSLIWAGVALALCALPLLYGFTMAYGS